MIYALKFNYQRATVFIVVFFALMCIKGEAGSQVMEPAGLSTSFKEAIMSTEVCTSGVINFGVSDKEHHIKIISSGSTADKYLYIDSPIIDRIELFKWPDTINSIYLSGSEIAFSKRGSDFTGFLIPITSSQSEAEEVYVLRVQSGKQLLVPFSFQSKEAVVADDNLRQNLMFLYFGIILFMLLYNGFLAISTKDREYYYYLFYIAAVGLTQASLFGFGDMYLWPNSAWMSQKMVYLTGGLSGVSTIVFVRRFISTKIHTPKLDKVLLFYAFSGVASVILAVFGLYNISYNLINFNAASAFILLIAAFVALRAGNTSARFFLVAWTIFIAACVVFALKDFGIIPYNNFTVYALPFGSAIEGALLSFALANKINRFKREKELSQERMIAVMQENQTLLERQTMELERMVNERTYDLAVANKELSTTLNDLKLTQKQLLESEKLASLGQMTAGIAHEINNPINFVSSNIAPLKRDVADLLELLDGYTGATDLQALAERLPALQRRYRELDIDFLRKEIDQLLAGIEEGSRRTTEIVKGLRIFSRMDRDTFVTANINECLNSTLMVMKNMTRGEVELEKELEAGLPGIDCFPGKLNQVFMNILNNAVQSTQLSGKAPTERRVSLRTWHDAEHVYIRIADNGVGMSEEVRTHIFDPFFTTKPVGEGTGLGLSIALGIVKEHNGSIQVFSEEGKGAEFLITLPRRLAVVESPLAA